jgi:flagellar export protein FliJ
MRQQALRSIRRLILMAGPKYRLQIVLDKRQKAKEEAEKALGEAQKALEQERKKEAECVKAVEDAKQHKENAKAELNKKILEGQLSIEKIRMGKDHVKNLDFEIKKAEQRLEQQRQQVKQAEAFLEQRRAELIEKTKDFQAIEKHKEKWAQNLKKEIENAEQNEQEEIGNVLFLARKIKESSS